MTLTCQWRAAALCLIAGPLLFSSPVQADTAPPAAGASANPSPQLPTTTSVDSILQDAANKLGQLANDGSRIKGVVFSPDGGCVILYDKNGWWAKNVSEDVTRKLKALADAGSELKWVAFPHAGGWVILYDRALHAQSGVPDGLVKKLDDLNKAGSDLSSISFGPRDGWAVFYDHGQYSQANLPDGATQKLQDLNKPEPTVRSIAFTSSGGWVILWGRNGWQEDHIPESARAKFQELTAPFMEMRVGGTDRGFEVDLNHRGAHISGIAFTPHDNWVILNQDLSVSAGGDIPSGSQPP